MVDIREKNIIIRADGNTRIGAGHLMRCLTIAEALPDKSRAGFVCADRDSAEMVRARGFHAYVLGTDYKDMEAELPLWRKLFAEEDAWNSGERMSEGPEPEAKKRIFLVDSYYVTNAYLKGLGRYGRVVLLDDMGKQAWKVSSLINYNVFATREMYQAFAGMYPTKYFLGGEYIPLRKEFCGRDYCVKAQVEDVLITTGGGDVDNIAGKILERIWEPDCRYHVVTGRFNPHYDELCEQAKLHGNIHIYHDVKDMAILMEQCDLAVTAGGTTVYELSAIGVPYVCFSYAENQEQLAEYVGRHGVAGFGGAYHKNPEGTLEKIARQIEEWKENPELRKSCSDGARRLVDGKGAGRIATLLQDMLEEKSRM